MNEELKNAKRALAKAYNDFKIANKKLTETLNAEERKQAIKELKIALENFQIAQKKCVDLQLSSSKKTNNKEE